jgi:hypothetical protein
MVTNKAWIHLSQHATLGDRRNTHGYIGAEQEYRGPSVFYLKLSWAGFHSPCIGDTIALHIVTTRWTHRYDEAVVPGRETIDFMPPPHCDAPILNRDVDVRAVCGW